MKILQFSYVGKDDLSDTKRQARSRCYEYKLVLDLLQKLKNEKKDWELIIHNSGCGWGEIHLQFAKELENYWIVLNTDNESWHWGILPNNFIKYDLLTKCNYKSDIVLCISTLEHLRNPLVALQNLIEATKEWWHIIITFDSPPVDLKQIEDYLWMKCKDIENKVNPKNSVIPNYAFDTINIVKLVIQK